MRSPTGAGKADVRQLRLFARKPREVTLDRRSQCGRRPRREHEQARTCLMHDRSHHGRLFEHDESIGASEPERIDRGAPRMIACGPVAALRIDEEGARGEVDLWVGIAEVEARRGFSLLPCPGGPCLGSKY